MHPKPSVLINLKLGLLSLMLFLILFCPAAPPLEAAKWGKKDTAGEFEGAAWDEVFCDIEGLYFTASMPNYTSAILDKGAVVIRGKVGDDAGYIIITPFNKGFKAPKDVPDFIKLIQNNNPEYIVSHVEAKPFGAKFAVDLVPVDLAKNNTYWRFLSTKNRLLKMGTTDTNEQRRIYFYESMSVKR